MIDINPNAGKPAEPAILVNVPKLITAYYAEVPDPRVTEAIIACLDSNYQSFPSDRIL